MTEDTYENRALFMMMWHGAASDDCRAQFPEWTRKLSSFKYGSAAESIWKCEFARRALEMRKAASPVG